METRKIVGKVTLDEVKEIQALFERKNGLTELAKVVSSDNTELYEKLVRDMGETGTRFQKWWDDKSKQYGWERNAKGSWEVDFLTGDITLIINV